MEKIHILLSNKALKMKFFFFLPNFFRSLKFFAFKNLTKFKIISRQFCFKIGLLWIGKKICAENEAILFNYSFPNKIFTKISLQDFFRPRFPFLAVTTNLSRENLL